MKLLRVEKRGCYGVIDGVFGELPIGHEFTAESVPVAFTGRVIEVSDVGETVLEVATPGDDAPEQPVTTTKKGK